MSLSAKLQSLLNNPAMLPAYACWAGSMLVRRRPPQLTLPSGAKIGSWVSFSEYWSFQDLVPERERLLVERCLGNTSGVHTVALDIGANLGLFTCLMANYDCSVHSFEPIPETFCRLKSNVKINGMLNRVHLNNLAVGRAQELVTFQTDENAAATNQMIATRERLHNDATTMQLVATISLDDYCERHNIERLDLVKLDVEGMEPWVLQGARSLLAERRIKAVLIEICPVNLRSVGLSPADLYHEFRAARYSPFALNEDGRPGEMLSGEAIGAMTLANVVLLPDA